MSDATKNEILFTESPASWNTRYDTPDGFQCQLTLRADNGRDLLERAESAMAYLLKVGCVPYGYGSGYIRQGKGGNGSDAVSEVLKTSAAWCPIHECVMQRWDKDGREWYSHKINGEWCKGK